MPKKRTPVKRIPVKRKYVDRHGVTLAHCKKKFLECLLKCHAPADAALMIGVSRATVYNWKKDDQEFDANWIDAVETALDKVESAVFANALAGDSSSQQFLLKHRRRSVYNNVDTDRPQQTSLVMNITMQEQFKRLERLGLPTPVIESDYEEAEIVAESDRESE